jgi:hypothetical protein
VDKAAEDASTQFHKTSAPKHQASQPEPTIEEIKNWDADELLEWIRRKRKGLLEEDDRAKLGTARVSGQSFLAAAGNWDFFKNGCNLPAGPSMVLADLSRELAKEESKLLFHVMHAT